MLFSNINGNLLFCRLILSNFMRNSQTRHHSARSTNKSQRSARSSSDTVHPSKPQGFTSSSTELSISYILSDFDNNKAEEYCRIYDRERAKHGGKIPSLKFKDSYKSHGNDLEVIRDIFLCNIPGITFPSYNITSSYFRFGKVKIGGKGDPEFAKIAAKSMFAYFVKKTNNETNIGDVQATGSFVQDVADIKTDIADMKTDIADIKHILRTNFADLKHILRTNIAEIKQILLMYIYQGDDTIVQR